MLQVHACHTVIDTAAQVLHDTKLQTQCKLQNPMRIMYTSIEALLVLQHTIHLSCGSHPVPEDLGVSSCEEHQPNHPLCVAKGAAPAEQYF